MAMWASKWLRLVSILSAISSVISSVNEQAVQSGKFQYELIQRDSQMPRFGNCWTKALESLKYGCKDLSDENQSRMALNFANCFLAQAGQKTYDCQASQDISDCLTGVDSNAFSAYTNFFTVSLLKTFLGGQLSFFTSRTRLLTFTFHGKISVLKFL